MPMRFRDTLKAEIDDCLDWEVRTRARRYAAGGAADIKPVDAWLERASWAWRKVERVTHERDLVQAKRDLLAHNLKAAYRLIMQYRGVAGDPSGWHVNEIVTDIQNALTEAGAGIPG